MKTKPREARAALRRFREQRGLTLRQAAIQLHVSHATLIEWERGTRHPSDAFRRAIEVWSAGAVPAESWPRSATERHMDRKAATVVEAYEEKKARRG